MTVYGQFVSFSAREYPERSRQLLVSRFHNELSASEQAAVRDWLNGNSLSQILI
ncbi:MAG: hypothetical protein ACI915_003692 [Gammaproteobacteria bacterium]|jgi:hypothetical protein